MFTNNLRTGILSACLVPALLCGASHTGLGDDAPGPGRPCYYRAAERGAPKVLQYDVAVYGGTPAGVTAAIQAARAGKNTVLLSFNRHVGGLTSGGLTATDVGKRESIGGVALEFYERIGRIKDFSPSAAEALFLKSISWPTTPGCRRHCGTASTASGSTRGSSDRPGSGLTSSTSARAAAWSPTTS